MSLGCGPTPFKGGGPLNGQSCSQKYALAQNYLNFGNLLGCLLPPSVGDARWCDTYGVKYAGHRTT